jgi:hypothetical protein
MSPALGAFLIFVTPPAPRALGGGIALRIEQRGVRMQVTARALLAGDRGGVAC